MATCRLLLQCACVGQATVIIIISSNMQLFTHDIPEQFLNWP